MILSFGVLQGAFVIIRTIEMNLSVTIFEMGVRLDSQTLPILTQVPLFATIAQELKGQKV